MTERSVPGLPASLLAALRRSVGDAHVLVDPAAMLSYECDALSHS